MIVKPAISWLTTDSDALLINDTRVVLKAMADNVTLYDKPAPPLPDIQTALDNFGNGVAEAAVGGPSATAKKNNLRLLLISLMRQLASYVTVACKGDMLNLILSGFPVQKPVRQPIGVLPAPQGLKVEHGSHRGELVAYVNPVFGAATYTWRLTPATPGATPVITQTTAAKQSFSDLTSGVAHAVEVYAMGAAGPSDWSNPSSLIAD